MADDTRRMADARTAPEWATAAARLPLAFAQVREDPQVDLDVLQRIGGKAIRAIAIASGGCTAAMLAASGHLSHLQLVDINPAQLAYARLKLHLLTTCTPLERMQLVGHAPIAIDERACQLEQALRDCGFPADVLGPAPLVARLGPDHAGRYEALFHQLRLQMGDKTEQWPATFAISDARDRREAVSPSSTLGRQIDVAFDRVMDLPNLVHLFGLEATRNSRLPFSRHFAQRVRTALARDDAPNNPWLWQMLTGRFPSDTRYPWLTAPAPSELPAVTAFTGPINRALTERKEPADFVHLSNVLDWLSPDAARQTLELVYRALRPGGYVLIRQLNSTLDIPSLCSSFEWLADDARELHAADRSFFYVALHLGRKR